MDSVNPQAPAMPLPGGLGMKFYRYRNLVRRHWWILTITVGLGLVYEGYVLFTTPQLFESVSQLFLREEMIKDDTGSFKYDNGNFFGTAVEQMKSPVVLTRARERIALEAPNLSGKVEVISSVAPRANIFTVTGTGTDPQYTQKFVDTVVDEFLKWRIENRTGQTGHVNTSLSEQEAQFRKELEQNKAKLQGFIENNSMQFWTERQNKAVAYLLGLKNQKTQLQDELHRLQNLTPDELLHAAAAPPPMSKPQPGGSAAPSPRQETAVNNTVNNPEFAAPPPANKPPPGGNASLSAKQEATFNIGLYTEYIQTSQQLFQRQADYEEWKTVWKPAHSKLKAIVADMERLQRQINIIKDQNANMVKARVAAINAELKSLEVSLTEWDAIVLEASRKDAEYQTLQSNVTRTQSQLEKLLEGIRGITVGGKLSLDPLQVMQKATSPQPIPPGTLKHLLIGLIGGLVIGSIILIVLDRADDRLSSSTEMIEH